MQDLLVTHYDPAYRKSMSNTYNRFDKIIYFCEFNSVKIEKVLENLWGKTKVDSFFNKWEPSAPDEYQSYPIDQGLTSSWISPPSILVLASCI